MTIGQTSNSYTFGATFSNASVVLEAYERCGIAPAQLTQQHMESARRSLQLDMVSGQSNTGPSLWAVDKQSVLLTAGVPTVYLPTNTVSVLDVYVTQYQSLITYSGTTAVSTVSGSNSVTIYEPNHGLSAGMYTNLYTQVSVGGIILYGYYSVSSVVDANNFTITASNYATSTVTQSGYVPTFTTANGSLSVIVTLANHGLSINSQFTVGISTTVGGITLSGNYDVTSIINANQFTISSVYSASSIGSVSMNGGNIYISQQQSSGSQTDRLLNQISRSDYAALPYKLQQGFPYSCWIDRTSTPNMTFWEVPDGNGPYVLNYYRLRSMQDANLGGGEIPDVNFRALDALCARLAARLSVKFAPDKYALLKTEAAEATQLMFEEDREKTPIFVQPMTGRYYRP